MSVWLFNNCLYVNNDKELKNTEEIEIIKERLSRLLFITAGFYKETGANDFISHIKINKPANYISIKVSRGICYIGLYSDVSKQLSTNILYSDISFIKDRDIKRYIKSLSMAEDYFKKHNALPDTLKNEELDKIWNYKITELEKSGLFPTKLSEIERVSGENISKLYWDNLSSDPYADATRNFLDVLYKEARNHNELSK